MDLIIEALREDWSKLLSTFPRIGYVAILFLIAWLVARGVGNVLTRVLKRASLARAHVSFFRNLVLVVLLGFTAILALNFLGLPVAAASVLTGGGVTAVVAAFAFREIGENLLAGFFLAFSRPFETGHLIRSVDHEGTVRGIDLRCTHIRAADGRDIFIPNAQILNTPLINYTKDGLRRFTVAVGIDYQDDAEDARRLLIETIRKVRGVLVDPAPVGVVEALGVNTVDLAAHYWIDTFDQAHPAADIHSRVRDGCRRALLDGNFTVSSNVTVNTALETANPVLVRTVTEG